MGATYVHPRYTTTWPQRRGTMPSADARDLGVVSGSPALLDHLGRPIDPAAIENVRQTRDDWIPPTSRVGYRTRTRAGVAMTPDRALTISAAWACTRYISQSVGTLPWRVKLEVEEGDVQVQPRHPIDRLLYRRPSDEWSSLQFRETMLQWALRWGNGFAEIERDVSGRPFALWPIHPSRVLVMRDLKTQQLFYQVWSNRASFVWIDPADMFHLRAFGEGPVGLSILAYAAESLGWAKAAQLFGANFFGGGGTPTGVVKAKKAITPEQRAGIKREWRTLYGGERAGSVAVLDVDLDYETVSVEPEKAQFVETQQFLLDEISRWFGVPPHKIYNLLRATFSNIEHQSIEVVIDSLKPWAKRLEDEADYKLFGQNRQGYFTHICFDEILRGDMAVRMQWYQGMRNIGALNVNEIRQTEGLNNIGSDGDKYTLQSGMTTLENIGRVDKALNAPQIGADGQPVSPGSGGAGGAPSGESQPPQQEPPTPAPPSQGPGPARQDAVKRLRIRSHERRVAETLRALRGGRAGGADIAGNEPRRERQEAEAAEEVQ